MKNERNSMIVVTAIYVLCTSMAVSVNGAILIDFGNNTSYRGRSVTNPDVNGNYWNSVDSSVYWTDLLNHDGTASTIDFGFSSAAGTDSYNGPAGPTTSGDDYVNVVIDAAALGDLGVKEAAFDFYVSSTFTLQQLDPTKIYNLTFYGSHMYNTDNVTVYTVYTSNDYAIAIASANLLVGVNADYNSNTVVSINGLTPQFANSIWVGFEGESGNEGYLNALKIDIIPEPAFFAGGLLVVFLIARKK